MLEESPENAEKQDQVDHNDRKDAETLVSQEQASKYNVQASEIHGFVQGDNVDVTINQGYSLSEMKQFIVDFWQVGFTRLEGEAGGSVIQKQGATVLQQEMRDAVLANETVLDYMQETIDISQTPSDVDEWYYNLDSYERCFVVATAMLHGSPFSVVSSKALLLFREPIQERSITKLKKRTYTVTVQNGSELRLFWQNSEFGSRVLHFLAEESTAWSGTQPGESYLDMLQRWPQELTGENSRRTARTLGALMSYQNPSILWKTANTWVESDNTRYRRLASQLLFGAYEVGCNENNAKTGSSIRNSIQGLLNQWTERFINTANIVMGCATAQTYSLLGRQFPEVALRGLGQLLQSLQYKKNTSNVVSKEFTSSIISAYLALAWSGHIRDVLETFALFAENLSHQHSHSTRDYRQYSKHREMVLTIVFDAFSLIAASSLTTKRDMVFPIQYSVKELLSECPLILDSSGKDVLLAGLLAHNEPQWHSSLLAIFCSMLIEKRYKVIFDLLRQWAETVIGQQGDEAHILYETFVDFMIALGRHLSIWCHDLQAQGIARAGLQAYKDKLIQWRNEHNTQPLSIHVLAQDVLLELEK